MWCGRVQNAPLTDTLTHRTLTRTRPRRPPPRSRMSNGIPSLQGVGRSDALPAGDLSAIQFIGSSPPFHPPHAAAGGGLHRGRALGEQRRVHVPNPARSLNPSPFPRRPRVCGTGGERPPTFDRRRGLYRGGWSVDPTRQRTQNTVARATSSPRSPPSYSPLSHTHPRTQQHGYVRTIYIYID